MTAKDPNQRFQSVDAVIEALVVSLQQYLKKNRNAPVPLLPSLPQQSLLCFCCGTSNPTQRVFCRSCGYDLVDKLASADHYLGSDGHPLLARLSLQTGQFAGRSYLFHQVETTIGRTSGNDLIISGRTVSRRHARLWFKGGRWYLEDMQSANGTSVNNVPLQPNQAVPLNDGDVINFGDEIFIFNVISRDTFHESLPITKLDTSLIESEATTVINREKE